MKKSRLHRRQTAGMLAASFVVTVGAAGSSACKKQRVDHDKGGTSVYRGTDNRCFVSHDTSCPKGVSCNPPAPTEVDCPASFWDGGVSLASTRRPPGKEDWLRVAPQLWASGTMAKASCTYQPEHFCSPAGKGQDCMGSPPPVKVACSFDLDAGSGLQIEPFVYTDGLGACRRITTVSCTSIGRCSDLPDGEVVPCPGTAAPRGT